MPISVTIKKLTRAYYPTEDSIAVTAEKLLFDS
jgi:hypothetical protein